MRLLNKIILKEKTLSDFSLHVFQKLYEIDSFSSIKQYLVECNPKYKIQIEDCHADLRGLFLQTTADGVTEANNKTVKSATGKERPVARWFTTPFLIDGLVYFLSNQWSFESDKSNPTFVELKKVVDFCYPDYSIKKDESYFYLYSVNNNQIYDSLQIIYYGAPGTGKSHGIEKQTAGQEVIRTTFHPDSDYSTFVGAYKPAMEKSKRKQNARLSDDELAKKLNEYYNESTSGKIESIQSFCIDYVDSIAEGVASAKELAVKAGLSDNYGVEIYKYANICRRLAKPTEDRKIVYKFIPQAFTQAYVKAWQDLSKPVFLVIEEINRGNCAQIFGDIFQLLDRKDNRYSSYAINPNEDIMLYLNEEFEVHGIDSSAPEEIKSGEKLCLPPNLYIWATMNTSDQSLFPIDSAFKRRWDWKYVPIDTRKEDWAIVANGNKYVWGSFLEKINEEIGETTSSEDKKLGFYFCKAKDGEITAERFVSKVLFYVYNDVFKDYGFEREFFKDENGKTMAFQSFYNVDGSVNEAQVEKILKTLKVDLSETEENEVSKDEEQTLIEEGSSTGGGKHDFISSITIDGENFSKDKMTHFEMYMNTLKKIGIDRVAPIIESCKYKRLKCDLATKTPNETILNSKYEYVKEGEYYFVKGAADETLINVLKVVKEALKLNLEIEIYN